VGEILGLGMSHGMGISPPAPRSGMYRHLERPDIPDSAKDPANWPEGLRKELGDDEGKTANVNHRNAFGVQAKKLRERLDAFKPDFVLIWADDQYENFKEDIIPAFCVQAFDDMEVKPFSRYGDRLTPQAAEAQFAGQGNPNNLWGWPIDKTMTIKSGRSLGKYLAKGLIDEKIDIAYAYEPLHYGTFAHGFLNSMLLLDWDGNKGWPYPTLTFQVNCYGARVLINRGGHYPVGSINLPNEDLDPDGPTAARCMEVGAATARILKDSPWRVALIASSSWSHAFLVPKHNFLYPDVDNDKRMYQNLVNGNYDAWNAVTQEDILSNGWQEFRNWFCVQGAMQELGHKAPDYSHFIETYSYNSSKVFAIWEPR
jgi:hypothetical protein